MALNCRDAGSDPTVDADEVLSFWFGEPPTEQARSEWFRKDAAFDKLIGEQFGAAIDDALAGRLDGWQAQPRSALARILLLDQFTRNVHRGSASAFDGDALALAAARRMVQQGDDRRLAPLMRWFVYLPCEHAEDLAAQDEALRLFGALAAEHPALADALQWAARHREVVVRFGRFPHRNAALGRTSTPEEEAFLRQPGSSF